MEWRRVVGTCGLVLLGATMTGTGMGLVLFQARAERNLLQEQIRLSEAKVGTIQTEHTRLIEEARARIVTAEESRKNAETKLIALNEAQRLLTEAPSLPSPNPRLRSTWIETIAVSLGVSLRTPSFAPIMVNNQTLTATINGTAQTAGDLWFSLIRYRSDAEQSLQNQLEATTTVRYRIDQRLLHGVRGTLHQDQSTAFVFRIEHLGKPEYLVWIRAISPLTEPRLLEILSTFTFAS